MRARRRGLTNNAGSGAGPLPQPTGHEMPVLVVVASGLLFAIMGTIVKQVSSELPNAAIVFFRHAFGLIILLPLVTRRGMGGMRSHCLHLHLIRSLFGLGAAYCFFFALSELHLADAVLLNFTKPLFIPFIALWWLGERISAQLRWALVLGFTGVALILKPGSAIFDPVALIALASAALGALAHATIRRLTRTEPVTRIVFYFAVTSTLVSAIPMLWISFAATARLWLMLLAIGVLATSGQLLLTRGYAALPASRVSPYIYTSVVFAALFDWWFWGQLPDRFSLLGTTLVCLGGILATRRVEREAVASYPV